MTRFEALLRKVYLLAVVNGATKENGNCDLSMIDATAAIAVFLDARATLDPTLSLSAQCETDSA